MSSDGSSPEQHEKGNFAITGGRSSDRGGGGIINNLDRLSVVDTRQSSITEYRLYKRRWLGLSALMGMNMVISWGWLTFAPVSTFAQQYYGLESKTPINWLSTVIFFTYIVASP